MVEITSFADAARVVYRGSRGIKIQPGHKTVDYSTRKRPEMSEITSFDDAARVVYRESRGIEILQGPKTVDYSPRKRPEMPEITMPLESCPGGYGASKSSGDPKNVDYSP